MRRVEGSIVIYSSEVEAERNRVHEPMAATRFVASLEEGPLDGLLAEVASDPALQRIMASLGGQISRVRRY